MHDLALTEIAALGIFLVTYFGLAVGGLPGLRVDRTGVAIIGAAAMVVTGVVPWDQAVAAVVGSFSGIAYRTFLVREALVGLVCVFAAVWWVYRRELSGLLEAERLRDRFPVHYPVMVKTSLAVAAMLAAFLVGVPIALVAIAGAALTLLTRRVKPKKIYGEVNWELLVLFAGLFVVIRGVETSGLSGDLLAWASAWSLHRPAVLTAVTAAVSNLVSNVPAVLLFRSVIPTFGEPQRGWLVLAMASTLAGNLTIVGSVANLIVVEAARAGRLEIGFREYCRVGVPLTAVTLVLGWLILVLLPA